MGRKKKLRIIQLSLLILGTFIIFFTYYDKDKDFKKKIISSEKQEKIKKQLQNTSSEVDVFYNIEYSGLDMSGNRYILRSKEAFSNKTNQEVVTMKGVNAIFYFKDDTILNISSEKGVYNNKSLDMSFQKNIKANYEGSRLLAQKAEYSNSKNFLKISENVEIYDVKGNIKSDIVFFDLKKQTLKIDSFNNSKINANINLK
tara:strand:- start:1385 stop:1987 length:603 start_codon:yes stop_codon:yes gene_type:complete